ncbi:hypothetical protein GGI43DRAFT_110325 [Trichoderma evansii]
MGDSQYQERPAKRVKLAPHPQPAGPPQPGPQLRFIRPAPFPSVVAPPRSTINMPLSWVNVLSTTNRPQRVRERVREPEPELERELQRGRGRGGRRGRGRGRASASESATPQTEEAASLVNADLETTSSPVSTESVSSQITTLTTTEMSPEYSPEASSQASSELSFEISTEVLSEATHELMQLDAALPIETVVVPQDISACKSTASECYAIISSLKTTGLHTFLFRDWSSISLGMDFSLAILLPAPIFLFHLILSYVFLQYLHHSPRATHHTPLFIFPPHR